MTISSHVRFPCVPVPQTPRVTLYVGALSFSQLWPLCTVTPRQPREDDPLYSDEPRPREQAPQREAKEKRIKEIAKFVEERLNAPDSGRKETIFPGTVILGLLTDVEPVKEFPKNPPPTSAILVGPPNGLATEVWLPNIKAALFIIDGQHRLEGLHRLGENLRQQIGTFNQDSSSATPEQSAGQARLRETLSRLEEMAVPVSLLLDFDLAEQAMVFADVNFNQKSVPRSFYFDIFGAFESDKVTTISFTHDLVLHLNNSDKSPLHGMIKLLGSGPGLVSQAYLGTKLTLLIDPQHPKSVFRDFFQRRQREDKEASRQIAAIIRCFFAAVRAELPYAWPTPHGGRFSSYHYDFILCKSMAMGGLLAVLGDIYRLTLLDFGIGYEMQVASAEVLNEEFFRRFLATFDPKGRNDHAASEFSRNSEWGIGGSAVLERRIYQTMRQWLKDAYFRQVIDNRSGYIDLIERFRGGGRARELLKATRVSDSASFWDGIDRMWREHLGLI